MFVADSFLTHTILQGDALFRFLSIAKLNQQEAKEPTAGLIAKEAILHLLPELDQELAEDITKGKLLVSGKVWFSIWPMPHDASGECRASIWLATKRMISFLPLPMPIVLS